MKNAFNGLGVAGLLAAGILYASSGFDVRKRRDGGIAPAVNYCLTIPADRGWPTGRKIAKRLDFDGDGKSDLVNWIDGEIDIDFSTVFNGDYVGRDLEPQFGSWDMRIRYADVPGRHVWPFMEDMDSDGREDIVLYVTDTGTWYVKLTRWPLSREMSISDWNIVSDSDSNWDLIIPGGVGAACKTVFHTDQKRDTRHANYDEHFKRGVYGRPLPGDYNGDSWVDLAVVCSDGIWRIDYGGPRCADYGNTDLAVKFLDEQRLAQAPGWAYLPIFDEVPGGRRVMAYKIPDGLPNAGQLVVIKAEGSGLSGILPTIIGGNDMVVVPGRHAGPSASGIPFNEGYNWMIFTPPRQLIRTSLGFEGSIEDSLGLCMPVLGDFDGDGLDDKAISCPNKWVISYSDERMYRDSDGLSRILLSRPAPGANRLVLPGVVYFGGISYRQVRDIMYHFILTNPGKSIPGSPVDMARSFSSIIRQERRGNILVDSPYSPYAR